MTAPRVSGGAKFLLSLALSAWAALPALCPENYLLQTDVPVVMRDATVLRADVLRPPGHARFPVLVYRTPYGKQRARETYTTFVRAIERGYAVVIQDVRGRYASDGEFVAYRNEGRDGYDTIEWAAAQPWSNGRVGTFGLSYPGAVQWLAAVESPPHLKAMVPAMTFSSPELFFYAGGVFDMSWISWLWHNIAPDVRVRKNLPGPKTLAEAQAGWSTEKDRMLRQLPLRDLPDFKPIVPFYYEWLEHPPGDSWWDWAELEDKYERVGAAVLNLSGWHDEAYGPSGAIRNYLGLRRARRGQADPRVELILGPWVHGVDALAESRSGERDFGEQARADYDALVLDWMDRYLKEETERPPAKPVRIFVMGANQWVEADEWPLPRTQKRSLYLHPGSSSNSAGGLAWEKPPQRGNWSEFEADPAHPVADPFAGTLGAHNQSSLAARADVLTFTSAPLEQDLEVTGEIVAELHVSSETKDADFWVRLLDLHPDGTAYNLMSTGLDVLRASYRQGGPRRELLVPGKVYRLRLANLLTSNLFRKGHRLQVQIMSSFFPAYSRNLQTGEWEHSSAATRAARHRIYHEPRRPSRLILPVRAR